ncbi:MAG: hypothetical protein PHN78_02380 [Dehalococcoidales bacterium]|nr:hypothetical protein [Dehalococcoidales bacterium]
MTGSQIDRLYRSWLRENYGEAVALGYTAYPLVIPMWNSPELNDVIKDLQLEPDLSPLSRATLLSCDYYEARVKLGLPHDRTPVPKHLSGLCTKVNRGPSRIGKRLPVLENRRDLS